jgi:hypothetical protein
MASSVADSEAEQGLSAVRRRFIALIPVGQRLLKKSFSSWKADLSG